MSIKSRLQHLLGEKASPVSAQGSRDEVTGAAPVAAEPNPYVKKDLDWDRMTKEAATQFEKTYYSHKGRVIFKWAHYLPIYDRVLKPFVGKPITLVEIGLAKGGSIELWREFLGEQIKVIGIDNDPATLAYAGKNVEVIIGDQGDSEFLKTVAERIGKADVVIDDGSHINSHQIQTFETLFPIIRPGGVYVCEDLHTSYWPTYGGGLGIEGTFISYFKALIDKLHTKYTAENHPLSDLSRHVGTITVADSIVAIEKSVPADVWMAWIGRE